MQKVIKMTCKTCGKDKELSEFREYRKVCKLCERIYNKKWKFDNPVKVKEHSKRNRLKRIEKNTLIVIAAWVGKTRLIDNIVIKEY